MSEMFEIDKDFNVTIAPEMRFIPEFREIIERDKGSVRDADGRKKFRAMKEMAYIYHITKFNGPYSNYDEKEKNTRLITDIFGEEKWKPDEEVIAAIKKWTELTETVSMRTLYSIKQTLYTTHEMINILRADIQNQISNEEYKKVYTGKNGVPISGITTVTNNLTSLLSVASEIPHVIDSIEKLEDKIKKEESSKSSRVKGNAHVSQRER